MRKHHKNTHSYIKRLKRWLRQWFIAGKHNHFHPKALRPIGLTSVALVLAFIPTLYNLTEAGKMQVLGYATNVTVTDLFILGNDERSKVGAKSLTLNPTLSQAALNKANDMLAHNYWAHDSPLGATPWSFITGAGYSYTSAGENLAKNFNSSAGVIYGWMNSPTHRDNVLSTKYQEVGYAVVNGVLLGEETTLVVAMYGSPYVTPVAAGSTKTTKTPAAQQAPATTKTTAPTQTTRTPIEAAPAPTPTQAKKPTAAEPPTPAANQVEDSEKEHPTEAATVGVQRKTTADKPAGPLATPVSHYTGLNWGQKTSLFILSALLLLFVMKHTTIWRSRKRGIRDIWLRAHPIAQGGILTLAIIMTLLSGTGSIL